MYVRLLTPEIAEVDETSIKRKISKFIMHPKYDDETLANDIGM